MNVEDEVKGLLNEEEYFSSGCG